jgi:hypothetical protein
MILNESKIKMLRQLLTRELISHKDSVDYDYKTTIEALIIDLTVEEYNLINRTGATL